MLTVCFSDIDQVKWFYLKFFACKYIVHEARVHKTPADFFQLFTIFSFCLLDEDIPINEELPIEDLLQVLSAKGTMNLINSRFEHKK